MQFRVIYNPGAGSAEQIGELRHALPSAEWCETTEQRDAAHLARDAGDDVRIVVAAGGDGTVNQVVNGLMSREANCRPALAVIPMGTGNDFARSLGLNVDDAKATIDAILAASEASVRNVDVVKATFRDNAPRWFINVAAGGFTGQMNEAMTDDVKKTWGPLAYLRGAITVVPNLKKYRTTIRYDDGPAEQIHAINIIVANGKTAGGGMPVAPNASLEDGLLDIAIVRDCTTLKLTAIAGKILAGGDYTNHEAVLHRRAKRVAVESVPGMWFNVDGELIDNKPATFELEHAALRVIVGAQYVAGNQRF